MARRTFSAWMKDVEPPLKPVVRRLRRIIFQTLPDAVESIPSENPWYAVGTDALYIAACSKYVSLGLVYGAAIRDDSGLLEGSARTMRYVKFRTVEEVDARRDRIAEWCRASASIAQEVASAEPAKATESRAIVRQHNGGPK